jgi:hypothetical protein
MKFDLWLSLNEVGWAISHEIAERDKRIAELEAAIMKISEITEREEQGPGWTAKIILALDAAIKKAEKLVEAGRE